MKLYQIITMSVLFLLALLIYFIINKGKLAISNKRFIYTLLCFSIGFTLTGFTGFIDSISSNVYWYFLLQFFALGMGILIIYLFKRNFFGEFQYRYLSEISLLVVNALLGAIGFTILFDYCSQSDLGVSFSSSILFFCIPYFFSITFELFASIPQEIYKVWYLNEDAPEPDFDRINVNRIYLLELELLKNVNKTEVTNLKIKAPLEMKFGDWFQSIVLNYNHRFEDDPIQYTYLDNSSMGWIFYVKPTFFKGRKYIDSDLSIEMNRLHEKMTIVAKRVQITYQ